MLKLDGKKIALTIQKNLKKAISASKGSPGLAFILVGKDSASELYVKLKQKACENVGIRSVPIHLKETVTEQELLETIRQCNQDTTIHGVIVQQPLPSQINIETILEAVDKTKDVDGFHPENLGRLILGLEQGFIPCTPLGIIVLLKSYDIDLTGKHVVIVGRSNIVGKPLASLLVQKKPYLNATVTLTHSYTKDLKSITKTADILISAVGRPHYLDHTFIKEGAICIDVGIAHKEVDGKQKAVGDISPSVKDKVSALTPVPGGVGPMTIAMLLLNTMTAYQNAQKD